MRHGERIGHTFEGNPARFHAAVDHRRSARCTQRDVDRQAEDGARVQFEFGKTLCSQRHQAGVVRTRADFGEPHLIALDEQLDAEDAASAETVGDRPGDLLRAAMGHCAHCLRLPRFNVVACDLQVADRLAETGFHQAASADGTHRQQRDFVVEVDEAFDDDAALRNAPALHGVGPGGSDILRAAQQRLPFAGR